MLFIHSQDIEQNPYFDINPGDYSVANLHTKSTYNPSLDLVNENVYTIFGLILMSIKGRNSVTNLGINQGGYSVANLHTKKDLQPQLRSCQ